MEATQTSADISAGNQFRKTAATPANPNVATAQEARKNRWVPWKPGGQPASTGNLDRIRSASTFLLYASYADPRWYLTRITLSKANNDKPDRLFYLIGCKFDPTS